jgi:hypothetical protein
MGGLMRMDIVNVKWGHKKAIVLSHSNSVKM